MIDTLKEWVTGLSAWLAATMLTLGYPGIVFLMAIESSFIPFPSEIVMPPAGYLIHEGHMSWFWVLFSGCLGCMIGSYVNYFIALRLGRPFFEKYGKYFFIEPETLDKADAFFAKHGEITTFVARLIPVIRQLISLPAGATRMCLWRFSFYTFLGAAIWNFILVYVGYQVGKNQELVQEYLQNATLWAVGAAAALVLGYIKYQGWKKKRAKAASSENTDLDDAATS